MDYCDVHHCNLKLCSRLHKRVTYEMVLELLKELVGSASILKTEPDDPSGIRSSYVVDHEQLMRNIQHELGRRSDE